MWTVIFISCMEFTFNKTELQQNKINKIFLAYMFNPHKTIVFVCKTTSAGYEVLRGLMCVHSDKVMNFWSQESRGISWIPDSYHILKNFLICTWLPGR
jgi:hypothetical protein